MGPGACMRILNLPLASGTALYKLLNFSVLQSLPPPQNGLIILTTYSVVRKVEGVSIYKTLRTLPGT